MLFDGVPLTVSGPVAMSLAFNLDGAFGGAALGFFISNVSGNPDNLESFLFTGVK